MSIKVVELDSNYLYRYIGDDELEFIRRNGVIYSKNPMGTYFTTLFTNDSQKAMMYLSLSSPPRYRISY
ncbi:hypothetical protein SJAV_01640 [Sulfurisphaera javensis]|uniref:Uncharacterized protein n=1 Tax=Sulfurisphaera javensis TaxID=2049879 RepID=A0AAT9GN49_9CREN